MEKQICFHSILYSQPDVFLVDICIPIFQKLHSEMQHGKAPRLKIDMEEMKLAL